MQYSTLKASKVRAQYLLTLKVCQLPNYCCLFTHVAYILQSVHTHCLFPHTTCSPTLPVHPYRLFTTSPVYPRRLFTHVACSSTSPVQHRLFTHITCSRSPTLFIFSNPFLFNHTACSSTLPVHSHCRYPSYERQ